MSQSILKQHAVENIWCEPRQDRHYVIEPERLTKAGGAFRYTTLLLERLDLPNVNNNVTRNFFHVYQIGKLNDAMFNLDLADDTWYNVNDLCEYQGIKIDVFLPNGAFILRNDVYLRNNHDNNFVVAIRINSRVSYGKEKVLDRATGKLTEINISLDNHKPILRFHKSAWYNSAEFRGLAANINYPIRSRITRVLNQAGYTAFRETVNAISAEAAKYGMATWYQDGFVISAPTAYNLAMNNTYLTYIWDSAVKTRSLIPIVDCPTFVSKLDQYTRKYLAILPDKYDTINYHDDLDFHLVRRETNGSYKGIYINRLTNDSIRMVTHNAYAVKADIISSLMASHPSLFSDLSKVFILITVRRGGRNKGLVTQATRIEDLYKLDRSQIIQAMTGVNSLIPEWRAENLEASNYSLVMGSYLEKITDEMVELAYGYNSSTKVGANPLHVVEYSGAQASVNVVPALNIPQPWDHLTKRHYFLYDENGLMINQGNSVDYSDVQMFPAGIRKYKYAEIYTGEIRENTDDIIFNADYKHAELAYYGYRCYISPLVNGQPTNKWEDVTGQQYYTVGGTEEVPEIKWNYTLLNTLKFAPAIKVARGTWVYDHVFANSVYPGYISFNVSQVIDGEVKDIVIAPGQVEVFMNQESLVQDIDYYMNWPTITIIRRPKTTTDIKIKVRMRGFCNPKTMKPFDVRDQGFINGGLLSVDDEYDVQADRNIRIVVDGQLKSRNDVSFSEDTSRLKLSTDGRAWAVTDQQVTVEHFTGQKTVDFLMKSRDLDQRVKDYLTPRLKLEKPTNPFIQIEPWALVSPFTSAIIHAFVNFNFLSDKDLTKTFVMSEVKEWIKPYESLLAHDPCLDENLDPWYIKIYPHIYSNLVSVTDGQYRFLEFIIRNYLKNRIDLTPSVIIGSNK